MVTVKERLKELFVGGNRNNAYLTCVEGEAWWISAIIFILFAVVLGTSLIFLAMFQPDTYNYKDIYANVTTTSNDYFNGTAPLIVQTTGNRLINQELIFYATFDSTKPDNVGPNVTQEYYGFTKNDLQMRLTLTGSSDQDVFYDGIIETSLVCRQFENCQRTYLIRVAPVLRDTFTIKVYLINAYNLYQMNLLTDKVGISIRNVSESFTTITVVLRTIFIVFSCLFTLIYFIALFFRQNIRRWATEQRFIVILLILTILYNNPIFFLEYLNGSWVFPFVGTLFIVTFVCFLMLSLLVFTHTVITTTAQRHFFRFYAPKFLIVGILWIFLVVTISLYSVKTSSGTSNLDTSSYEFIGFSVLLMILFIIYFLALLYYFFRVASKIRILPGKNRKKFIFTWLFTFVIIILTVIDVGLYASGNRIGGSSYNAFFIGYNLYTISMSVMFWPAKRETTEKEEQQEEEVMKMAEESEFRFQ